MKYYSLMKYANNAVGAVFRHCTEQELEKVTEEFEPDYTNEISKEEYEDALKTEHKRGVWMATGHWIRD